METKGGELDGGAGVSGDPAVRLKAWQQRLETHFTDLAAVRRPQGWPVFALEHGLTGRERASLIQDVRASTGEGPTKHAPLPWVVYAAEIGYEYSGYEYWQTFEAKTAGWQPPWRNRIRSRFEAFAEAYHGAQPEGDWARQFNIIAWPITHGILPQDLQRQLAELLYDASMTFRAETFSSAEALGLHLQSRSSGYSSRFRQFAENVTLLGQIALALLLQDSTEALGGAAGTILHADTLTRIVEDLNRERDARQWLAEARSAARFRVRGLSRISLRDRTTTTAAATNPSRESPHRIGPHSRPRFLLREEAPDRWQVRLQLPNLAQLAAQSPRSGDVLTRTQGRVEGATVPILATGRIVREATPVVTLATWPAPQTQLLSFDGAPPELDAVLRADFRTDAGEFWLFLIGSDGLARELTTRVLRAGASYLLLQRTETRNPVAGLGFRVVRIACTGIFGLRLDIAEDVPDALVDVLAIFGLEVAQTLEVWPAGLPAPEWSGDGAAEWVAGHPIVLGVRTDHRFTRLTLTIDGVRQPDVDAAADAPLGSPVFVQLPSLRPGPHQITVAAHTAGQPQEPAKPVSGAGTALSGLRGELSCFIREPRTLAAGQAGALSFAVLPSAPSLEDVWEDRIEIHAAAPGVTSLRGRVVFRGSSGQELFNRPLALPSPCDTAAWRREFKAVRRAAEAEYDAAQVCVLEFSAEALGRGRVTAERDFTPLRWAVLANGHRAVLVDSQGCTDLTVCTVACATPSLELPVEAAAALEGIVVSDGGALIVARSGRLEAATVVVPPQRVTGGFAALAGERPNVPPTNREPSAIAALARAAALWERARLAGSSLAEHRRGLAVEALVGRIMSAVGGGRWITAEEAVRGEGLQSAAEVMRQLIAHRPNERAVGVLLAERVASTAEATVAEAERVLLGALAPFVHVQGLAELATYGLRLAASPVQARTLVEGAADPIGPPDARERTLINGLLACPIILRAARYFVIATRALHDAQGRDHRALPWES